MFKNIHYSLTCLVLLGFRIICTRQNYFKIVNKLSWSVKTLIQVNTEVFGLRDASVLEHWAQGRTCLQSQHALEEGLLEATRPSYAAAYGACFK